MMCYNKIMSETLFPKLPNESVIPRLQSEVFLENPTSRFAVGVVGVGDTSMYPVEKSAYHELRANVYARQTGMLSMDQITDDGEYDDDDARSVHMAILENRGNHQRVVAASRLIIRQDGMPLPVEQFFPGVFSGAAAPDFSIEVSRYIARHEDARIQDSLRIPTFARILAYIAAHNLGPTYAVIEPFLERKFRMVGVPCARLADPQFLPKYNETNIPILIDTQRLADRIRNQDPKVFDDMVQNENRFSYFGFLPQEMAKRLSKIDEIAR